MENNTQKNNSGFFEGILILLVVLALFVSGSVLGKFGSNREAEVEEDTQVEDVVVTPTTEPTTQPTTAPTTQPSTEAPTSGSDSTADTTAPAATDPTEAPSSGERSKAEIIALFIESANKVKTDATKVVKNYEDR